MLFGDGGAISPRRIHSVRTRCWSQAAGQSLSAAFGLFVLAVGRRLWGSLSLPHSFCSHSLLVESRGAVSLGRIRSVRTRCWSPERVCLPNLALLSQLPRQRPYGSAVPGQPMLFSEENSCRPGHTSCHLCQHPARTERIPPRGGPRSTPANTEHEQNGYRREGAPPRPGPYEHSRQDPSRGAASQRPRQGARKAPPGLRGAPNSGNAL